MPISKATDHIAVFSRNHPMYLEAARKRRGRLTTFRSKVAWVTAERALQRFGALPIYFVSIDEGKIVDYRALLVDIQLRPNLRSGRTKTLLKSELPSTKRGREVLWDGSVKSLYVIKDCRKLAPREQFSQTRLRKVSNGEKIQRGYKRSYSIVHAP